MFLFINVASISAPIVSLCIELFLADTVSRDVPSMLYINLGSTPI